MPEAHLVKSLATQFQHVCELHLSCVRQSGVFALQVALPPDQLTGVIMSSPASEVTIQSGFSSLNFGISSPFSSGNVYALGLDTANLSIANSG